MHRFFNNQIPNYDSKGRMIPQKRDFDLCSLANYRWKTESHKYDDIKISCFNKSEADMLKKIMDSLYPKVPVYFTWDFNA